MFTVIDSAFDSAILTHPGVYLSPTAPVLKARRRTKTVPVQTPRTPRSLWRCTLAEDDESRTHCLCVRAACAVTALLSVGSIGYAAWRVCALMSDDRLHDAVAAFAH